MSERQRRRCFGWALASALAYASIAGTAFAEDQYHPEMTKCQMVFNIKGWSFVVKSSSGEGTITCDNGQKADVKLTSLGGGFTIGKSELIGAKGVFTEVSDIKDLYGTFAEAEGHAGATESGSASVLTKGEVSLAITGKGKGIDIGVTLGGFTIEPM